MPARLMNILALLAFFTLAFSVRAEAGWRAEAVAYANANFGYFPGPQSLPRETQANLATVYGGAMREVRLQEDLQDDQLLLKLPALFKMEMKVFLRKQDHPAPLLVFIPGVFANANDGIARGTIKWFSEMGYHVLTIPNFWSRDFAKAAPIFQGQYPDGEAKTIRELVKSVIANELGKKNVSSVQIMGESLGALTVAVVYSRDSRSLQPIFTGGATLTWPPIALHAAMAKLDDMMASTQSIYETTCHHSIKRLITKWRIFRGDYLLKPTQEEIECAPAIVAQYSFRKELVKLAQTINDVEHLHRQVPSDLTFSDFVKTFAPRYSGALSPSDHNGQIEYWLRETDARAAMNIRILTSEDDFLNQRASWNFTGFFAPAKSQMINAHWGGHIGLTITKAYEGLMRTQFALH